MRKDRLKYVILYSMVISDCIAAAVISVFLSEYLIGQPDSLLKSGLMFFGDMRVGAFIFALICLLGISLPTYFFFIQPVYKTPQKDWGPGAGK